MWADWEVLHCKGVSRQLLGAFANSLQSRVATENLSSVHKVRQTRSLGQPPRRGCDCQSCMSYQLRIGVQTIAHVLHALTVVEFVFTRRPRVREKSPSSNICTPFSALTLVFYLIKIFRDFQGQTHGALSLFSRRVIWANCARRLKKMNLTFMVVDCLIATTVCLTV